MRTAEDPSSPDTPGSDSLLLLEVQFAFEIHDTDTLWLERQG